MNNIFFIFTRATDLPSRMVCVEACKHGFLSNDNNIFGTQKDRYRETAKFTTCSICTVSIILQKLSEMTHTAKCNAISLPVVANAKRLKYNTKHWNKILQYWFTKSLFYKKLHYNLQKPAWKKICAVIIGLIQHIVTKDRGEYWIIQATSERQWRHISIVRPVRGFTRPTVKHLLFARPYFRGAIRWDVFTRLYFRVLTYFVLQYLY